MTQRLILGSSVALRFMSCAADGARRRFRRIQREQCRSAHRSSILLEARRPASTSIRYPRGARVPADHRRVIHRSRLFCALSENECRLIMDSGH